MMSARHWRERPVFWHALIFWVWLASFVFGFAASDLFHAPNCPEQLALRAAAHAQARTQAKAQLSESHALHLDAECPTCLLQLVAQGVLVAAMVWSLPLFAALVGACLLLARAIARPLICSARGPPLSFI